MIVLISPGAVSLPVTAPFACSSARPTAPERRSDSKVCVRARYAHPMWRPNNEFHRESPRSHSHADLRRIPCGLHRPSWRSNPQYYRVALIKVQFSVQRDAQWAPKLLNELFVLIDGRNSRNAGPVCGLDVNEAEIDVLVRVDFIKLQNQISITGVWSLFLAYLVRDVVCDEEEAETVCACWSHASTVELSRWRTRCKHAHVSSGNDFVEAIDLLLRRQFIVFCRGGVRVEEFLCL